MRNLIDKLSLIESTGSIIKLSSKLHHINDRIVFDYKVPNPTTVKFNFSKPFAEFEVTIQYIKMYFLINKEGDLIHDVTSYDDIEIDPESNRIIRKNTDYGDRESIYQKAIFPLMVDAGISQGAAENFPQDMAAIDHGIRRQPELVEEINAAYQWRQEQEI